ncbi:hypothetical protein BCR32DRAFT_277240 [Anaeromyces robustus]|uniref:Uncharacterized protein n=1 Tax=Anaeromyces robustus TaxID=1754192 RepID=A0A1Y1XF39_9FUNG|nr:hypothetical protein BCR32DRAFT_277240 [Anaeromyces robustus]|eukprot:ORX84343.1 hypothetical protein BCR32DRAFT_277240 [Anaeromyces robustus]
MTKNRTEETSPNNEDESNVKRNRSSSLPYIYSDEETVGSNNLSNAESIIPTQIADSLTLIPNTSKENIPRVDPLSSTQPDPSKIPSELLNTSSSLLNSISSFNPLENEPTDQTTLININSINEKNKGIYNQIIQQSPSFISPDLFLLSGDAPSSSNASLIKASHQTKTEIDHNKPPPPIIDSNLFTPSDGGLPLFTPNYLDPQLQYLMSQTSQALSSNIMEYLDTSNPNTINPLTDLSNTTHTLPSQPHPTSLETAFNYDIINNMLWPQDTS